MDDECLPSQRVSAAELAEMEADRLAHERPNELFPREYCENSKYHTHSFRERNPAGERICSFCKRRFDDVFKVS